MRDFQSVSLDFITYLDFYNSLQIVPRVTAVYDMNNGNFPYNIKNTTFQHPR